MKGANPIEFNSNNNIDKIREILFGIVNQQNVTPDDIKLFRDTICDMDINDIKAIEQLLSTPDELGATMLGIATLTEQTEIAIILSQFGARMSQNELDNLIKNRANIDTKNENDNSLIHIAAISGQVEVIAKLVESNANIHVKDNSGNTPLHIATKYGWVKAITELLKSGADINARDHSDNTPLHLAVTARRQVEVITELLKFGADIEAKNNLGRTPLYHAINEGDINVISELLESGADIYSVNNDGDTPLSNAISSENNDNDIKHKLIYTHIVESILNKEDWTKYNVNNSVRDIPEENIKGLKNNFNDNINELLGKRITNKLSSIKSLDVKGAQKEIINNLKNLDIDSIDAEVALIQKDHGLKLLFLKSILDSFIHSENNARGIVHNGGIITLSNLTLLELAKTNQLEKATALNVESISDKVSYLSQIVGISRLIDSLKKEVKSLIIVETSNPTAAVETEASPIDRQGSGVDNSSYILTVHPEDVNHMTEMGSGSNLQELG